MRGTIIMWAGDHGTVAAGADVTLADLLSGDIARAAFGGSSGRGVLVVLLATASVAVPYFRRHRLAPLAFAVPLVVTAAALWPIYREHSRQQAAVEAMGEFGEAIARGRPDGRASERFRHDRIRGPAARRGRDLPGLQGRPVLSGARPGGRHFIVGIVNSAPTEPSGQRAVTVLSLV